MKIDPKIAEGIIISGDDFEYIVATRKPNTDTKIISEFWFKGTIKKLKEISNE